MGTNVYEHNLSVSFSKESIRNSCVAAGLVSAAAQFIESDDSKVVLQALRAVGNMNYENGNAHVFNEYCCNVVSTGEDSLIYLCIHV